MFNRARVASTSTTYLPTILFSHLPTATAAAHLPFLLPLFAFQQLDFYITHHRRRMHRSVTLMEKQRNVKPKEKQARKEADEVHFSTHFHGGMLLLLFLGKKPKNKKKTIHALVACLICM